MGAERPCRYLDWDSDFFGRRIASVEGHQLTPAAVETILAWCAERSIDCLYFLADSDDAGTLPLAQTNGFALVDVRVTLACDRPEVAPIAHAPSDTPIRPAREADIPALRAIARVGHRDSRFYFDGHFSEQRCDALYETWIENSCRGYADVVFVADVEDEASGYISCHLKDGAGQIGLVGVGERARGRGVGGALVRSALTWFEESGARNVTVVTQGRNTAAQRLYQRGGFVTQSLQLWYHRWFDERSDR